MGIMTYQDHVQGQQFATTASINLQRDWYNFWPEKNVTLSQEDIAAHIVCADICLWKKVQLGKVWSLLIFLHKLAKHNKLTAHNRQMFFNLLNTAKLVKKRHDYNARYNGGETIEDFSGFNPDELRM